MTDNDTFLKGLLGRWDEVEDPIRPSHRELQFYERHVAEISRRENPDILIQGSTPEFRDLAIRYGMKPVSADLDRPIWEAMKHFMKEEGEEEFLHCNWLELPADRKYDLIIGDGPLNMLPDGLGEAFFESLARTIKDDGRIVQRIISFNEDLKLESFEGAMTDFRNGDLDINLYGYTVFFANNVGEADYPHLSQLEVFDQVLSPFLTKEELDEVRPFLLPMKIGVPTRDEVRALAEKHFLIEEMEESEGVGYWGMANKYVFRKKSQ